MTLNIKERLIKYNKEKDESQPLLSKYFIEKSYKERGIRFKTVKKDDVRKFEIDHHTYKWWIKEIQDELIKYDD